MSSDVVRYRHQDLLLRVNWICGPTIPLQNISDAPVLSLAQFFRADRFDHARETISVRTAATANHLEAFEVASVAFNCVLNEAAPVVLLDRRPLPPVLRDFQKVRDAVSVSFIFIMQFVTHHNGFSVPETKAL